MPKNGTTCSHDSPRFFARLQRYVKLIVLPIQFDNMPSWLLFFSKGRRDKLDAKGIESVRRDNCGMVRHVVDTALQKILIDRDIKGSIEYPSFPFIPLVPSNIREEFYATCKGERTTFSFYFVNLFHSDE